MIFKPSIAKYSITVFGNDLTGGVTAKLIASSAHDIVSVLVNGASGPVAVRVLDRADIADLSPKPDSVLVQAKSSSSFEYHPIQARPHKKGIVINFEQGQANAEVTILFN